MIHKLILCIIAFCAFTITKPSVACQCAIESVEEAFEQSDIVFIGHAAKTEKPTLYEVITSFETSNLIKGPPPKDLYIEVHSDVIGPSCGIEFDVGQDYLIFAIVENGNIFTNSCFLSTPLSEANEILESLKQIDY